MLMRRGHRLHSIAGAGSDLDMRRFASSLPETESRSRLETRLVEAVMNCDIESLKQLQQECSSVRVDQKLMEDLVIECVGLANKDLLVVLVDLLATDNMYSYEVGEFAVIVSTSSRDVQLTLGILDLWVERHSYKAYSPLDVVAISLEASSAPSRPVGPSHFYGQLRNISTLAETAIYVATVDKYSEVLRSILSWVAENRDNVGDIKMENADCILHASLEDDKEQVRILYAAGFRLCADTTRRLNKDYLKKIKLFKARASPVYCTVAFEQSHDVDKDDPMKKCLDFALEAKQYSNKIQDFNKDFNDIAEKCENFAIRMLEKCTTKHEIQTLLQTKSYRGHHDANFNIAILDGHKELVAHEKFQQLLHKKWGQRDRVHYGDEIRYNIFWSELTKLQKFGHFLKQVPLFFILPILFLLSTVCPMLEKTPFFQYFMIQTNIPVNRFIYFETSKTLFTIIIFLTLIDEEEAAWYDLLAVLWIISFLVEDFRTIQRLYSQGGAENRSKTIRRWLTFKNIYVLVNNLIFLTALILRYLAYSYQECRASHCPYEDNKMAFNGACLWAIGALMTFLRNVQTGLMWRQTGPIIISMTYMIIDVLVFLFIFVIVYISFTLVTVYVYEVYDNDRTQFFNSHKSAFKLFWWSLIRTGNPHFPNIREFEQTLRFYNSSCIGDLLQDDTVEARLIGSCALGKNGVVGEFDDDIEEGVPYITGNIFWAVYQFITFIVLLSVLRARMVNTYHRIFREADVQWKFFRASLWWKYLDHNTVLPPPFTVIYLLYSASRPCWKNVQFTKEYFTQDSGLYDRKDFYKRYKRLLLTLVRNQDNSWGYSTKKSRKSMKSMLDCGGD